jgi:CRISPR/Cas system-associated exonuclease Cas4 (RecB family)
MDIDFDALIDRHIARESRPKSIGRYYPSEIGKCIRNVWYSYNHPLEIKPELRRVFEMGNILHDFVIEVLRDGRNGDVRLLEAEMPFKMGFGEGKDAFVVSGRIDDLLLLEASGKKILVEVKSSKSLKYMRGPMNHHMTQLQFYMFATGVHDGILLYVDKSSLETRSFDVKFSDDHAAKIVEKFGRLHKHLVDSSLPSSEAKNDESEKWMCSYCEYADKCAKDEK